MKGKQLYSSLLLAGSMLLSSAVFTSCNDFLTLLPTDQLPEENFWQDKSDVDGVLAGAYDQLAGSSQTTKILQWGELRSDNLTLNNVSNSSIDNLQKAVLQPSESMFDWSGFYTGINLCNLVIEKGDEMTTPGSEKDPSFNRSDYLAYKAEMVALRSLYYFYLVRSFRDVPYVTNSIRTDKEAMASKIAATPGIVIIGQCINDVEANLPYAANNLGSDSKNKGRFTQKGLRALLADMYLWRACLLRNYCSKDNTSNRVNADDVAEIATAEDGTVSTTYKTASGEPINNSYCNTLSKECLEKAKQYAEDVIKQMKQEYQEEIDKNPAGYTADEKTQPYPFYLNSKNGNGVQDYSYYMNFGLQNSDESIFELQYDGTTTTNGTVNSYLSTYSSNQFNTGIMTLNNYLTSSASTVDPSVGFGKTDIRLLETCYYPSSDANKPISKFVLQNFSINDLEDLTTSNAYSSISGRQSNNNSVHWPVYRLTDVMLIKSEAIARLGVINNNKTDLQEGYKLVNEIFKRNNPALVSQAEAESNSEKREYGSERFNTTYSVDNRSASDLLKDIYRERQIEFVAEGKRWYDLVRQAEFSYVDNNKSTANAFGYGSFKSTVTNRLTKIYSMYNPIYSEEMKVNGVGYVQGGQLVQNPIWDRYTKK